MGRSILTPLAHLREGETVESTNKEFPRLLDEYYKSNNTDRKIAAELWRHIFRTSRATMVQKYNWMKNEQIDEWAIDCTMLIMNRINNREKWPEGYRIKTTIATVVRYALWNVAKSHQLIEEKEKLQLDWEEWLDYKREEEECGFED